MITALMTWTSKAGCKPALHFEGAARDAPFKTRFNY
jgi:hypothetical protein